MRKTKNLIISAIFAAAVFLSQTSWAGKSDPRPDLKFRLFYTEDVSKTPVNGRIIIGFQIRSKNKRLSGG